MSGGGGGVIIIRAAMKQALVDPLVHGNLPKDLQAAIDPVLAKDVNAWTMVDHHDAVHAFVWAAEHC